MSARLAADTLKNPKRDVVLELINESSSQLSYN
jgi:hypothetical protein